MKKRGIKTERNKRISLPILGILALGGGSFSHAYGLSTEEVGQHLPLKESVSCLPYSSPQKDLDLVVLKEESSEKLSSSDQETKSFFQKYKKWMIGGAIAVVGCAVLGTVLYYTLSTGSKLPLPRPEDDSPERKGPQPGKTQLPKWVLLGRDVNNDVDLKLVQKEERAFPVLKENSHLTSIQVAILLGRKDIVERLLEEKGIELNAYTRHGNPLCTAIKAGNLAMATLLLEKEAKIQVFHVFAAIENNLEMMQLLLNKGKEVEISGSIPGTGTTALHWAATHGNKEMAQFLLEKGIDKSIENHMNKTAEEVAREKNFTDLADFIHNWTSTT